MAEFEWRGEELLRDLREIQRSRLRAAAAHLRAAVRRKVSGALRKSVTVEASDDPETLHVGTSGQGVSLELGSVVHPPRPFVLPAFLEEQGALERIARGEDAAAGQDFAAGGSE